MWLLEPLYSKRTYFSLVGSEYYTAATMIDQGDIYTNSRKAVLKTLINEFSWGKYYVFYTYFIIQT